MTNPEEGKWLTKWKTLLNWCQTINDKNEMWRGLGIPAFKC